VVILRNLRSLSRRDFLKLCGAIAVTIGLSETAIPEIAEAIETAAKRPPLVWLEMSLCTGDSEALIQSTNPSPAELVLDILSIDYWDTIMAPSGKEAEKSLEDAVKAGDFLCVVEGAIPTGENGHYLTVADKTGVEILKEVSEKAKAVIAIGNCATYGGIPAANPNPTESKGVDQVIEQPVVNIPGCPCNGEWLVDTAVYYLIFNKLPELDKIGRPKMIFGQTVHENCPRRAHFEAGEFVEEFGSPEEEKGYCLYKVGCKGPEAYCNSPIQRWNDKVNWCVGSGTGCIACTEPKFWDKFTPLYDRLPGVTLPGIGNISVDTIGKVAGAATAVGIGAHFIGQAVTGRLGKGAPPEGGE
jgi:NiFe hydrogenase small subunit HydA